jgi:hypothetical protein
MKLFTVGVTGTQSGMNAEQTEKFTQFLFWRRLLEETTVDLIHGGAKGVDVEAAAIANDLGIRSSTPEDKTGHFARNRAIVDRCDVLVVIPWQDQWQSEGGTWYTHDYAEKKGIDIVTIWPSAEVNQLIGQGR